MENWYEQGGWRRVAYVIGGTVVLIAFLVGLGAVVAAIG